MNHADAVKEAVHILLKDAKMLDRGAEFPRAGELKVDVSRMQRMKSYARHLRDVANGLAAEDLGPPEIPQIQVVEFTDDQLRQIYDRIELISKHFERCCGSQRDVCHYDHEYDKLYQILHLAGVEEFRTPFDREEFEHWLGNRGKS
jgi:hypothetical protein